MEVSKDVSVFVLFWPQGILLVIVSLPQADLGVKDKMFNMSRSATERAPETVGRPSRTNVGINVGVNAAK